MGKYICGEKCFHNLKLFRKGDIYIGGEEGLPRNKEGDIRNFKLLDEDAMPNPAMGPVVKVNEKVAGASQVMGTAERKAKVAQ
jgi:hypothetical protein